MSTKPIADMHDTRKPVAANPSPAELALLAASKAFASAAEALDAHDGPRQGEAYTAKVATWRSAYEAVIVAGRKLGSGQA